MEDLCSLLFELSNEDRLKILRKLEKKSMNVTGLSRELNLTTQEASRHISRLVGTGLTQKDTEGYHHITHYGNLILEQLEGLAFLTQHREYFSAHSLVNLPPDFNSHIGDLAHSTYVDDISLSFYNVEKLMKEAEEYVWVITDHYLMSTFPLYTEVFNREVKVKSIDAKDWVVPTKIRERYSSEDYEAANRARTTKLIEERLSDRLDVYLYMSEKEVAMICFPLPDGRFDYLGFTSTDEQAHKWCRDLFLYYWDRAIDREIFTEESYNQIKNRTNAIQVLKKIAAGKEVLNGDELVSELENMHLLKEGKLTISGDMVFMKIKNIDR